MTTARSTALLSTTVELSVSGKGLKSKDAFSKSDAVCILFLKDVSDGVLTEIGRTEEIKDNPNPAWMKKFEIDYKFEEKQIIIFRVYDWDKKTTDVKKQDLIGEVECKMAEIMLFQGRKIEKELPKKCGTLLIVGQEMSACKDIATILFSAEKLDKMDTFGKSDPFLILSRLNKDKTYSQVFNTGYQKNTLNPEWQEISIPVRTLCGGDYQASIKIECFDWDKNQKHDLIGECVTTLNNLKDGKPMPLVNPKKVTKKGYKNSGVLKGQIQNITEEKSFLDYLRDNLQLHFTIAVDFTASNGNPKDPDSLHYLEDGGDNSYTTVIKSIGDIFHDYERELMIPALGFGARVPPENNVCHEFFMNGSSKDPYCKGIDGVIEAYKKSLNTVELFGPTNFSPVITHVSKFAKSFDDGKHYFILLIITDGVITDMPETLTALIDASSLPISVIIVGVGNEDFSAMQVLDADDKTITFEGRKAERDIVQFVEFNKVHNPEKPTKSVLSRNVLKEVPQQCVTYMKKMKK